MTRTIDNILLGTTKEPAVDLYEIWMPRIGRAFFALVFLGEAYLLLKMNGVI